MKTSLLTAARQWWGTSYSIWGRVIGQPFRVWDELQEKVIVPGEYVHYERIGAGEVHLALLGIAMRDRLVASGMIPYEFAYPQSTPDIMNGIREWVIGQFGSVEQFEQVFGMPITMEFGLSSEQMQSLMPQVLQEHPDGYYICTLTERSMLCWSNTNGTFLVPLGRYM